MLVVNVLQLRCVKQMSAYRLYCLEINVGPFDFQADLGGGEQLTDGGPSFRFERTKAGKISIGARK